MNLPTILILALIGIALFAALRSMKKHPSGCSGHCSGCPVQCKVKTQIKQQPVRSKSGQAAVYRFLKRGQAFCPPSEWSHITC